MANLIECHAEKIVGVLSCFDRLVLQGTLPSVAYPQAMATELDRRGIRLFDYAKQFALPFREAIRAHAERVAAEEGVEIEFIQRMKNFRKEDRIQQILANAREPARAGAHLFGHGALPDVRAVARQEDRLHLHSSRSRQVSALL